MIEPNRNEIVEISQELIVSAHDIGHWLNLSPSSILANDDLITSLILTATEIVEKYIWVSLRRKTIEAYYYLNDYYFSMVCTGNEKLLLNRSPIINISDIEKIEYLANDIWNEFDRGLLASDGLYKNVTERIEKRGFASIYFIEPVTFESRENAYKIRVTYKIGYDPIEIGPAYKLPALYKNAIMTIVAFHFTNRGDCESECSLNGFPVPCAIKGQLDLVSLRNTIFGGSYEMC